MNKYILTNRIQSWSVGLGFDAGIRDNQRKCLLSGAESIPNDALSIFLGHQVPLAAYNPRWPGPPLCELPISIYTLATLDSPGLGIPTR